MCSYECEHKFQTLSEDFLVNFDKYRSFWCESVSRASDWFRRINPHLTFDIKIHFLFSVFVHFSEDICQFCWSLYFVDLVIIVSIFWSWFFVSLPVSEFYINRHIDNDVKWFTRTQDCNWSTIKLFLSRNSLL